MKKHRLTSHVAESTKKAILKISMDEKRSESNVVDILILEALIERGKK